VTEQQKMNEQKNNGFQVWHDSGRTLFFALIAEMDLVVKNLINIFFISRFLGADGAAAYEIVMPCVMVASAFVALGYNGVQATCAKDYGARDFDAFERHKNAGYTWIILAMAVLTLLFAAFQALMLDLLGANEGSEALAHLSRECYSLFLLNFVPQGLFSIASCLLFFEERQKLLIANLVLYGTMLSGCVLITVANPSMAGYMTMNIVGVAAADLYIILSSFVPRRRASRAAFTALRLHPADIRDAFFTGLPDFMEYGFVGLMYLVENLYLLSRFSESVIAGIGVFEAIDNFPEVICVGFSFLVTTVLGERVGKLISMSPEGDGKTADRELAEAAKRLTKGGVLGSALIAAALLLSARPLTGLFLTGDDPVAVSSAVWLTVSCALGFVFYMLNSELVCYYKIVGAYGQAHVLFFAEALLFPLGFKLLLGELFGVVGFCLGGFAGELAAFVLNLCLVWKAAGHFPKRLSDFRMDKYLLRQTKAQSESRAGI